MARPSAKVAWRVWARLLTTALRNRLNSIPPAAASRSASRPTKDRVSSQRRLRYQGTAVSVGGEAIAHPPDGLDQEAVGIAELQPQGGEVDPEGDRKSTRLNS